MTAPDPDPLYVEPEEHVGPHFVGEFSNTPRSRSCPACQPSVAELAYAAATGRMPEKPRSPAVILYLAVILVAIATGAIIALLWWGLR